MRTDGPLARINRTIHGDTVVVGRLMLTCEQMLRDRGCTRVTRADDVHLAVENGTALLRGRGPGVAVDVFVIGSEDRVGVKHARAVLDACADDGATAVVVSAEGPTAFTRKECEGRAMQFFCARVLCYNVSQHSLVPRHERVEKPPEGVSVEALPKLPDTDPVAQYYHWPVGTVVRVWRCFSGHEPVPYYRVVCTSGGVSTDEEACADEE